MSQILSQLEPLQRGRIQISLENGTIDRVYRNMFQYLPHTTIYKKDTYARPPLHSIND